MSAAVVTERKGGQVRLRYPDSDLPVTVNTEKGVFKSTLSPNRWVAVPYEVFDFLKSRYGVETYRDVVDHDANQRSPHKVGEAPITRRERTSDYIMEFKD